MSPQRSQYIEDPLCQRNGIVSCATSRMSCSAQIEMRCSFALSSATANAVRAAADFAAILRAALSAAVYNAACAASIRDADIAQSVWITIVTAAGKYHERTLYRLCCAMART